MPIRPYKCGDCGKGREYLVPQEKVPERCPGCGSFDYFSVITAPNVGGRTGDSEEPQAPSEFLEVRRYIDATTRKPMDLGVVKKVEVDLPRGQQKLVARTGVDVGTGETGTMMGLE